MLLNLLISLLLIVLCNGLSFKKLSLIKKTVNTPISSIINSNNSNNNNKKRIASIICSSLVSLSLPIFATSIINMNAPIVAYAAEGKEDKKFELCISKCIFEETKPPPIGSSAERLEATKSRGEIIRECRVKCAKNKEQLLIGKPKIKADNQVKQE